MKFIYVIIMKHFVIITFDVIFRFFRQQLRGFIDYHNRMFSAAEQFQE